MENETMDMIIKNVKTDKTVARNGYDYYRNATINVERTRKSLFVFIVIAKRTRRCGSMNTKRRGMTKLWISKGILTN
jgi:hypothetical protein